MSDEEISWLDTDRVLGYCNGRLLHGGMMTFLKNIFTARDNASFSLTKLLGIGSGTSMIYNFIDTGSAAFQDFGIGIGAIMAALAAKYHVEDKEAKE